MGNPRQEMCLDLDPDVGGKVGQVFVFDYIENKKVLMGRSFGDWLTRFITNMERGGEQLRDLPDKDDR